MKIIYNFVSVVVIGRFNPAILTVEFLKEVCSLEISGGKYLMPPNFPFPKEIQFNEDKLSFYIDLDRFQVKEVGEISIDSLGRSLLTNYTKKYLEKLPYTPISTVGINFNLKLILETDKEAENFFNFINDEKGFFETFKTNQFILQTEKDYTREKSTDYKTWVLTHHKDENYISSVRIVLREGNEYELNHNIEARDLQKNPNNVRLVLEDYNNILEYHKLITEIFLRISK